MKKLKQTISLYWSKMAQPYAKTFEYKRQLKAAVIAKIAAIAVAYVVGFGALPTAVIMFLFLMFATTILYYWNMTEKDDKTFIAELKEIWRHKEEKPENEETTSDNEPTTKQE